MTTDAIYEEHGSDWSHRVSAVGTTQWLQCDQTLPLSCEGCGLRGIASAVGGCLVCFLCVLEIPKQSGGEWVQDSVKQHRRLVSYETTYVIQT